MPAEWIKYSELEEEPTHGEWFYRSGDSYSKGMIPKKDPGVLKLGSEPLEIWSQPIGWEDWEGKRPADLRRKPSVHDLGGVAAKMTGPRFASNFREILSGRCLLDQVLLDAWISAHSKDPESSPEKTAPEDEEGYFFLKDGDDICEGDEWLGGDGEWIEVFPHRVGLVWSKDKFSPYRRKAEDGYRILRPDEIAEDGDQVMNRFGEWVNPVAVGIRPCRKNTYRRKIETGKPRISEIVRDYQSGSVTSVEVDHALDAMCHAFSGPVKRAHHRADVRPVVSLLEEVKHIEAEVWQAVDRNEELLKEEKARERDGEEWRYVLLKEGELIEEGDEAATIGGLWKETVRAGERVRAKALIYRRKISWDPLADQGEEEISEAEGVFEFLETCLSVLSEMEDPNKRYRFELLRSMACLKVAEAIEAVRLLKEDQLNEEKILAMAKAADEHNESLPSEDGEPKSWRDDDGVLWRFLEPGETIKEGDEYCKESSLEWLRSKHAGFTVASECERVFRRKIDREIEPGEGYRILERGETLKDGDEYFHALHDAWLPTCLAGVEVGDTISSERYRRKIVRDPIEKSDPGLYSELIKESKRGKGK